MIMKIIGLEKLAKYEKMYLFQRYKSWIGEPGSKIITTFRSTEQR